MTPKFRHKLDLTANQPGDRSLMTLQIAAGTEIIFKPSIISTHTILYCFVCFIFYRVWWVRSITALSTYKNRIWCNFIEFVFVTCYSFNTCQQPTDDTPPLKGAWSLSCDPFQIFWVRIIFLQRVKKNLPVLYTTTSSVNLEMSNCPPPYRAWSGTRDPFSKFSGP